MKTAVLRLYRGDDAATAEAEAFDAAPAADPAAPRVLPFPRFSAEARPVGRPAGEEAARVRRVEAADGRDEPRAVTLRFHAPHEGSRGVCDEAPDVLPLSAILSPPRFRTAPAAELPEGAVAGRIGGWVSSPKGVSVDGPLSRAKALHANRTCKSCGAGGVEPVLLSDGVVDAAGAPVPGSGTLVGFHCCRCQKEWPVA